MMMENNSIFQNLAAPNLSRSKQEEDHLNFLDSSFSDIDCGPDDSLFGDSRSESDTSEFGHIDIISDFALFDSYFSIENILGTNSSLPSGEEVNKSQEICPSSPFDTKNFPTSVNDISKWLDFDPVNLDLQNNKSFFENPVIKEDTICYNITVPVVNVKEEVEESMEEDIEDSEEEISVDDNHLLPCKRIRIQNRKYSSGDSDSDEDWAPEESSTHHLKGKSTLSKSKQHGCSLRKSRPIPQRRAPGTKQKITQWIVGLLRDPKYNPKVITWLDEEQGVFQIKDTAAYARLWGKVKHNQKMTYEKLSRAMRYSYKNDELRMVPEKRLTYRFGSNMLDFRAEDKDDPNFTKFHRN